MLYWRRTVDRSIDIFTRDFAAKLSTLRKEEMTKAIAKAQVHRCTCDREEVSFLHTWSVMGLFGLGHCILKARFYATKIGDIPPNFIHSRNRRCRFLGRSFGNEFVRFPAGWIDVLNQTSSANPSGLRFLLHGLPFLWLAASHGQCHGISGFDGLEFHTDTVSSGSL